MSAQTWKAPRFEVMTNRHPASDGQAWGWIKDRESLDAAGFWRGESERLEAEKRAEALNREAGAE